MARLFRWLERLAASSYRYASASRQQRVWRHDRLAVEVLEGRVLLATLVVTNPTDVMQGGSTTLRQAIAIADADAMAGISDTIVFDAGLSGATIVLGQGPLRLSGAGAGTITIDASTLGNPITVSGNNTSRVFQIDAGVTALFQNLVIANGLADNASGGGILNQGSLRLNQVMVAGNFATRGGGGIANESGSLLIENGSAISGNTSQSSGGGIYNESGTVTLDNTFVTNNSAKFDGGGIYTFEGAVEWTGGTVLANNRADGSGGGVFSDSATLNIGNATLSGNTAQFGGAIYSFFTAMTATQAMIRDNVAAFYGGGLLIDFGNATLQQVTLANNRAEGSAGGGIYNDGATLNVSDTRVVGNSANLSDPDGLGGGIYNQGGTASIARTTFRGNSARQGGGFAQDGGAATLSESTFWDNSASDGGGLFSDTGAVTVTNTTFWSNAASGAGGAILAGGGTLVLNHLTVSGNSAASGGGIANPGAALTLRNSIVSNNAAGVAPDFAGSNRSVTADHNLIGSGNGLAGTGISHGTNGNLVGLPAFLSPLADYGGATPTLALLPGSAALASAGADTVVAAAVADTTSTTIGVAHAAAIAGTPGTFLIRIDDEQMLVTAVNLAANTLTVARGVNGTTPAAHAASAPVYLATDQRGLPRPVAGGIDLGTYQSQNSLALAFTSAGQTLTAGEPSGVMTVQLIGPAGAPAQAESGGLLLNFATSSNAGIFLDASGNPLPGSTILIPQGENVASFRYRDTVAGSPMLAITGTGIAVHQEQTVNAAAPSALVFATPPQILVTGRPSDPITVRLEDAFGNPAKAGAGGASVILGTSSVGGAFQDAQGNALASASVPIAAGATSGSFRYTDTLAGNPELTATAAAVQMASQHQIVNLPATITWTGAVGNHSFQEPGNWDLNRAPIATDQVVINTAGITVVSRMHVSILSIQSAAALNIAAGSLEVTQGSSLIGAALAMAAGTSLTATGMGTSFSASGATAIDGANLYAKKSAALSLPGLVTYNNVDRVTQRAWQAIGAGSTLTLANLTNAAVLSVFGGAAGLQVQALQGGQVSLPLLATINNVQQPILFQADGSAGVPSQISLPALTNFLSDVFRAGFTVTNGGTILAGNLSTLHGVTINLDGTGTIGTGSWTALTGARLFITGGSYSFANLTNAVGSTLSAQGNATMTLPVLTSGRVAVGDDATTTIGLTTVTMPAAGSHATINVGSLPAAVILDLTSTGAFTGGTTFDIAAGAQVNVRSGSFAGGAHFNVGAGASLAIADPIGIHEVFWAGTLTGSGDGTVRIAGGPLVIGPGGVTFNLPGNMFQWTAGQISSRFGGLTNLGTMNLAGSSGKFYLLPGVFDNQGVMIQTGGGNFELNNDAGGVPSTFLIGPGASYLLQSDSGFGNPTFTQLNVINAGTIAKTAGSFTSTIGIAGSLTNTGTISASAGTLAVNATTIAQISGSTLTGGVWEARNGAKLMLPTGTNITTNAANLLLDGAGATITGIANLATNSGGLTVNAGATLTLSGNYTQTASGKLTAQIGGAPASGQFGKVNVAGAVSLAGTFALSLADGFTPAAGFSYVPLSFTSKTGNFDQVELVSLGRAGELFTAQISATALTVTVVGSAADLQPTLVSAPPSAALGQSVTVNFTVHNNSATATAAATWTDSIYLSPTPNLNSSAILLGRVAHVGAVGGNGDYSDSLTAQLPALQPGKYHVLFLADSQGLVPDAQRANNLFVAGEITLTVSPILLDTPVTGAIGAGEEVYYRLNLAAAQPVQVVVSGAAAGLLELATRFQAPPDFPGAIYDLHAHSPAAATQSLVIPGAQAGPYFIAVHGRQELAAGTPFTITVTPLAFQITGLSRTHGSNLGPVTVTISGSGFSPTTTATLVQGGVRRAASTVLFQSSTTLFATFHLGGLGGGAYNLELSDTGDRLYTQPGAFTVEDFAAPGRLELTLQVPELIRAPFLGASVTINYANRGGTDIVAPLLSLTSDNADFRFVGGPYAAGDVIQFLAINQSGPAGVLPPGFSGSVSIPFVATTTGRDVKSHFTLNTLDDVAMDWSLFESSQRPPGVSSQAWAAIVNNLTSNIGATASALQAALAADATYLSQMGIYTGNMDRLMGFEIAKASGGYLPPIMPQATDVSFAGPGLPLSLSRQFSRSIPGRTESGRFGLGWTDNWDLSFSYDSFRNLNFKLGPSIVTFLYHPDDGTHAAPGANAGTVAFPGGGHVQLRLTDSTLYDFNPNGSLHFIEEVNGNRITADYNGLGQLVKLTHANGSAITLSYNAEGFVSQAADPAGRITSYAYDAAGHLLQAGGFQGTTQYTYVTNSQNLALEHALTSARSNDLASIHYSYDSQGRLSAYEVGGRGQTTLAYGAVGGFAVTDANGSQSQYLVDDHGNIRQVIDPLGRVTRFDSPADQSTAKIIYADGTVSTHQFDANGFLSATTDELGHESRYVIDPAFGKLTRFQDARGNSTTYTLDPATGNVLAIGYADGTTQTHNFDSQGNLIESINGRGQATEFTYDAHGRSTHQSFADGTFADYTFDALGNLISASNAAGTFTLEYDAASNLKKITYPGGRFLQFNYNAANLRTRSEDQTGFIVNYRYDAAGRLEQLTDGAGANIVTYAYDAVGRLIRKLNGNGTATEYIYDAAGNVLIIRNLAPDGTTVNSEFVYAYDARDRIVAMTTAGETTTYGYDATGQLTLVGLPDGRTIQYQYDAVGNRVKVIDSALGDTDYTTNERNEYTQIGATSYAYDAAGNLISQTQAGDTTTYRYNSLNQMLGISSQGGNSIFLYDPFGSLYQATEGGETVVNQRDYSQIATIVSQFDGAGALLGHYTSAMGLASVTMPDQLRYFYDSDNIGNVVGITDPSGSYVNRYQYLPFGETTVNQNSIRNPFTFGGLNSVLTEGDGLFLMGYRRYDAAQGRFVASDPLGLVAGDPNTRRFVFNDPLNMNDPLGLCAELTIRIGNSPHAQFFFDPNGPYKHVSNVGFFGGLGYEALLGFSGKPLFGVQGLGRDAFRPIARYDDVALADSINYVMKLYQDNGVQFQLWDGHNVAEAIWSGLMNDISYNPVSPADLTHHRSLLDLLFRDKQSNCQEFAYWVNYVYPVFKKYREAQSQHVVACDPNDITGPTGIGEDRVVLPGQTLPYHINFENEADATAPAQTVVVTTQLDANLDWSTFRLGDLGFGKHVVAVPGALNSYRTRVDATGDLGVLVDIDARVDLATGLVTWTLRSLDPVTLDVPMNPLAGLLPPNDTNAVGQGFMRYTIEAKGGLPGSPSISAKAGIVFDTNEGVETNTVNNLVNQGFPAVKLAVQAPVQAAPGGRYTIQVTAHGIGGQPDILASGPVALGISGGPAGGKISGTLTATLIKGVATFTGVSFNKLGSYTLFAGSPDILQSGTAAVNVAAAPQFVATLTPLAGSAGNEFTLTVSALVNQQPYAGYLGTIRFTSSDKRADLPAPYTFQPGDLGTKSFTLTLATAGMQTVTVSDIGFSAVTGAKASARVTPLSVSRLAITRAAAPALIGVGARVTVIAQDAFGNRITNYTGRLEFSIDGGTATLPVNYAFTAADKGARAFIITPTSLGALTLGVSDGTNRGASPLEVVSKATRLSVKLQQLTQTAGNAFQVTVTALDAADKPDPHFRDALRFTSRGGLAYEEEFTSDTGSQTFTVTLTKAGFDVITVTAIERGKIKGASPRLNVLPLAATRFALAAPAAPAMAGMPYTITATAQDRFGNPVGSYRGTAQLGATGGAAMPANLTFNGASAAFKLTPLAPGNLTLNVIDGASVGMLGLPIVSSATRLAAGKLPASITAGQPFEITVSAFTAAGTLASSFRDVLNFASSAGGVGGPADRVFTSGTGQQTFLLTLAHAGRQIITITDRSQPRVRKIRFAVVVRAANDGTNPVADAVGPSAGVPGQALTFHLSATETGASPGANWTYRINWGDRTTTTAKGPSGLALAHTYAASGTFTISVTAIDSSGDASLAPFTRQVTISSIALTPDPADGGRTALAIASPAAGGAVTITPANSDGTQVAVSINGAALGTFAPTGRILVFGRAGADVIKILPDGDGNRVAIPALLFGKGGNDTLSVEGSSANNVLVGGAGNNKLTGGSGRDILIGGSGAATARAGSGGSILIGGSTIYDAHLTALTALSAEWGRTDLPASQRIEHLFGSAVGGLNGAYRFDPAALKRHAAISQLFGGDGIDWFLFTRAGAGDRIGDLDDGESATFW